jgi:hypothetical protein
MKSRFPPSLSDMSLSYLSLSNIMSPSIAAVSDINDIVRKENPAKCPSSGKNPPKFATAYVVY